MPNTESNLVNIHMIPNTVIKCRHLPLKTASIIYVFLPQILHISFPHLHKTASIISSTDLTYSPPLPTPQEHLHHIFPLQIVPIMPSSTPQNSLHHFFHKFYLLSTFLKYSTNLPTPFIPKIFSCNYSLATLVCTCFLSYSLHLSHSTNPLV